MILGNYENKNYAYIVSGKDELESIYFVGDSMQEVADYLGIDISAVSRFFNRENNHINRKIERVKIYDYVYIIYEKTIDNPTYIAYTPYELAQISGFPLSSILSTLHPRKDRKKTLLYGRYKVSCVDLLDLDFSLADCLQTILNTQKEEMKL